MIFAIVLGVYFFQETYTEYSLLGIFLILTGVILNTIIKKKKKLTKTEIDKQGIIDRYPDPTK